MPSSDELTVCNAGRGGKDRAEVEGSVAPGTQLLLAPLRLSYMADRDLLLICNPGSSSSCP